MMDFREFLLPDKDAVGQVMFCPQPFNGEFFFARRTLTLEHRRRMWVGSWNSLTDVQSQVIALALSGGKRVGGFQIAVSEAELEGFVLRGKGRAKNAALRGRIKTARLAAKLPSDPLAWLAEGVDA